MRILKPDWVSHTGYPIFSVDIHPDGSRFATGGGDNKVIIWAMAPVQYEEQEANSSCPRKLAELTYHMSPISCVRWSHNGQFLASGSDDALVMLWKLSSGPASKSFGSDELTQENWRCTATLRGHSKDITDVAWSPDDTQLASCSVDNEILVWDTSKNSVVTKLSGHNGFVKGISWDPMGRYIASQSEDKTMLVWRCSDWKIETKIEDPFVRSAATTFYRRPSWSPDGQFISAAHAFSGPNHVAMIVGRDTWHTVCDFVGHKLPIVVTRFNPVIFADDAGNNYGVCLIGGQDNTISVWTTISTRPLLALNSCFKQSVLDASWAKDGFSFMCCSTDGTVVWVEFGKGELGTSLTSKEMDKVLKNIYGDHILSRPKSTVAVAEDPSQLYLPKPSAPTKSVAQPPPAPTKQTETRLANGRRRIQPQFLGNIASTTATTPFIPPPTPFTSSASFSSPPPSSSTSSTSSSSTSVFASSSLPISFTTSQSAPDSTQANGSLASANGASTHGVMTSSVTTNGVVSPQRAASPAQSTTSITSTTTASTTSTAFVPPAPTLSSKSNSPVAVRHSIPLPEVGKRKDTEDVVEITTPPPKKHKKDDETDKEKGKESEKSDKGKDAETDTAKEKEKEREREKEREKERRRREKEKEKEKEKARKEKEKERESKEGTSSTKERSHHHSSRSHISAAQHAPKLSKIIWEPTGLQLETKTEGTGTQVSCRSTKPSSSPFSTSSSLSSTSSALSSSLSAWRSSIPGRAVLVAGNQSFSAVAAEDSCLYIFSAVGRLLFPPISMSAPLSFLEANKSSHLAAITSDCLLYVWNVIQQCATITAQPVNISPPSSSSSSSSSNLQISHLALSDTGQPVIICTSHTYVFHTEMKAWMKIDSMASPSSAGITDGFLSKLMASADSGNRNIAAMTQENDEMLGGLLSMESHLAASLAVGSSTEYKYWLLTYARYLTSEADINRLTEVCKSLLGPPTTGSKLVPSQSGAASGKNWEPSILGMAKRELLRELLPIMSANRGLQRLVAQFREGLDVATTTTSFTSSTFNN